MKLLYKQYFTKNIASLRHDNAAISSENSSPPKNRPCGGYAGMHRHSWIYSIDGEL